MKALLGGVSLWLALNFVALLVLANEVRFQGCVNQQSAYMQASVAAAASADSPFAGIEGPECSRIPFVAG
jgi:hypothetical protein